MLYFSKRNKKKISEIIHAFNPDILFTELIRTANYCITGQHYTVCDLADLFSKRYENQLQSISHIKIQGQYRFNNGLIESLLNHSGLKSCILRMEAKLVANFEKVIPHIYDLTTLVSPVEVEQLKTLSKCDKISWVPNGTNKPSDRDLPHPTACLHIAFLGVLDVPHNQEGVIHFLNEIFPMVLEEEPSAIFNIYGKCNSTQLLNKCENTKNVRLMGFVEDLEMSISTNHVFVSPLLSGTGVQTKLFEAMKCGVPIITTKIGAEGICYDGSPPFIIADDPNTFVKQLLRVYREQPLRNQLSKRGMATVANYYWDKVGKRLNNVLQTNCF
ncbi:MAG: glycosyltransferase family 4 protein [Cyclobacteriaceae bacterium]